MSSSIPGDQQNGTFAPNPNTQTIPNGKSSAAPPQTTTDGVELKNMAVAGGQGHSANGAPLPIESDIMQLARLGEIGAMQKLFDTKKYNAKHADEEGITPLHVSLVASFVLVQAYLDLTIIFYLGSGLRSITSMRCVGSFSTPEQM